MSKKFDEWYEATFGSLLGGQDEEIKIAVRKIWNGAMDHAARELEMTIFEKVDGEQAAKIVRKMKVK